MQAVSNKGSSQTFFSYLLFIMWPIMAVVLSLRHSKQVWAKNVVWFFVIFYGYYFVIPNEGADGYAYQERFIDISERDISTNSFSDYLYRGGNESVDILEPVISYTLAQFTNNPKILFAVYGLIFGFFYSRNLWFVLSHNFRWKYTNIIVFVLFAFSVGIWEINGFRFWCATHIFFYGAAPFITTRNKKWIFFILLSALMHFSFLLPVGIVAIYYFAGNRSPLYFAFFLITFFIAESNISAIRTALTLYVPNMFASKVEAYTSDVYIDVVRQRSANVTSFNFINSYAASFIRIVLITIMYFDLKKIEKNKVLYSLFCFTLLFYGFANIFKLLPSGGRLVAIASLFTYAMAFIYSQYISNKIMERFLYVVSPLAFYVIIYNFRIIAKDTFSIYSFSNPIINFFF